MTGGAVAVCRRLVLRPDPSRVVTHLFVPGRELADGKESRVSGVVQRILDLDEAAVVLALDDVLQRFDGRHLDIRDTFRHHADRIANRLNGAADLSDERWLLLGATFTHEYSVEAAAACNPSMALHPDQSSAPAGAVRFILSLRGIGEGHRSSIGFRNGTIDASGAVSIEEAAPSPVAGRSHPATFSRAVFRAHLRHAGVDGESAAFVLDHLPETFTTQAFDERLAALGAQRDTRRNVTATINRLRSIAERRYRVEFPSDVELSRRVLWPAVAAESHGMEDARFVRFIDDDGGVTYYATYTAYDGTAIRQQLIMTRDFVTFEISSLAGKGATNKGLALFPRRIDGRFAGVSRFDGETNAITFSDDPRVWEQVTTLEIPQQSWELIQLGNCGPPIETPDGWLVLTHGVGPMRTYRIGALLLDLDDPTQVIGQLTKPLLSPSDDEQDGYVPNVVYSCGGLLHGDTLVVPYGIADTSIGIATVSWQELRAALLGTTRPSP